MYQPKEKIEAKEFAFMSEGIKLTAKGVKFNDAFYEITEGKYKGNLVHIFDVIQPK